MTATTHSSIQGTANWLIFRIGRVACAVPALSVTSILPVPEHITALPGADAGSPGLFHHGSGTVAIIDLRHRFGCDSPDPRRGRLLLGRIGSGSYGFWVDSIVGLTDAGQVKAAPLPPELPHNVFTAALRHQDEIVLCSDLARLLAMRDAGGLRHLVCAVAPTAAPARPETSEVPRGREERVASTPPGPAPAPPPVRPPAPPAPRPAAPPAASAKPVMPASRPGNRPAPTPRHIPQPPPRPTPAAVPRPERAATPPSPQPAASPPPAPPPPPATVTSPSAARLGWPVLLLAAALAGGWFLLWPGQAPEQMPMPTPSIDVASEPAPVLPAPPPPATAAAVTPVAAPPLFQGEGILVEQDGKDITIIIDRARPAPEPQVPAETMATATTTQPAPDAVPPATAEPGPAQMYVHTVVRGDTLWAIAEQYLDDPWRYKELAQLSRIKNPDLIYPGNKVRIIIR